MRYAKGFTLMELVVVIVVLGMLFAVVGPRFMDVRVDSRMVIVETLEDNLRSSVESVKTKAQLSGVDMRRTDRFVDWNGDGDFDDGDGIDLRLDYGYPEQSSLGIDLVIDDMGGFSPIEAEGARHYRFNDLVDCYVSYVAPQNAGARGVISSNTSGCE
ncbi:MAG: prepilin-type N-terminal cleavage/methylation domain-containing protein [Candidatus Azotimanducaceae bacterium]|jgi:prepilin-type N-terminal cleavage/methylation domain-containing protein